LSTYRVIIDRLWAVSPYIFANCCSVGRSVVQSSFREAVLDLLCLRLGVTSGAPLPSV